MPGFDTRKLRMIFGFNTDVSHAGTVYHVQSEAREGDRLVQTQVFVRGRCVGKQTSSYAAQSEQPDFSEQSVHELLKQQHRAMLAAIREGRINELFPPPEHPHDHGGFVLEWLNAHGASGDGVLRVRFRVSDGGKPVAGAQLTSRLALSTDAPVHSQALTTLDGEAEIDIRMADPRVPELILLVQATHADKCATRKFRLKKTGN